jgi:isoamyl acetate esterase
MSRRFLIAIISMLLFFSWQQKPREVIFFGDSITELGVKPGGYIAMLRDSLKAAGKEKEVLLTGAGVSGNKIYDLWFRMEADVLAKRPDMVVVYIGVNDIWHKTLSGTGTDAVKFTNFYSAMIRKFQEAHIRVVLCTPAVIGEKLNNTNQHDGDLNAYSNIIRDLAVKFRCPLVDLRKIFIEFDATHNPENKESGVLTRDRVHLNEAGNRKVADALYPLLLQ